MPDPSFTHTFPAVRGMQGGRPCYIAMCPLRIIPKLFVFDEEVVPPELRAQRTLNKARVPEIATYLTDNSNNYTLSSLTASIDSRITFDPLSDTGLAQNMGTISIPMDAQILINDGQHRRAAIEEAIKEEPELGHDNISVLFFIDEGLARSQQMFADLNKNAVRPNESISTLYDLRDPISELARYVQKNVRVFSRLTELEKSTISNRSRKLFTLSSIRNASKAFLQKSVKDDVSMDEKKLVVKFWNEVATNMTDWQEVLSRNITCAELREQSINAHGVMLQAMGSIGPDLIVKRKSSWEKSLKKLSKIDWSRLHNSDWEGRAMVLGRISKSRENVLLTGNYIKQKLGLQLNAKEEEIESKYLNG